MGKVNNKLDELHGLLNENVAKVSDLLRKEEVVEQKKKSKIGWIIAGVAIAAVIAAAIYGLYRFFSPDYLEDFEDDFDDEFEDDFFEDDDEKETEVAKETDTKVGESKDDVITDAMTEDED